jgi:hypothetical protein
VLAAAEVTRHAQRLRMRVDHDHGMGAIFVTLPAVILDGLAGPIEAGLRHVPILYPATRLR